MGYLQTILKKMNRRNLEHIIRAAGAIAEVDDLVIIGSQAILGAYPDAPSDLLVSQEADIYPLNNPEKADLIDGSIGEGSLFNDEFGYYAHGVGPETAVLPQGWKERLIPICNENTKGITGWCLSPVDLAISKLYAGRDRDIDFVRLLIKNKILSTDEITYNTEKLNKEQKNLVLLRLKKCQK